MRVAFALALLLLLCSQTQANCDYVDTVAGTGVAGFSGDGGQGTAANFNYPASVVFGNGLVYISDEANNRIRTLDAAGNVSTIAGTGAFGHGGDGGPPLTASFANPFNITISAGGDLYITEYYNQIRKISSSGVVSTVAGNGTPGYSGDGGPAIAARLQQPFAVAVAPSGEFYIADFTNHRVRRVDTLGNISTFAGNGFPGFTGDGVAPNSTRLNYPAGLALNGAGELFISDAVNRRIRKVSGGIITTIAGTGVQGFSGDGGPATAAELSGPYSLVFGPSGDLYFTDGGRVRKIDGAGIISTVAGTGASGYGGDGGPALAATFLLPYGLAIDTGGIIYVADQNNNRIRRIGGCPPGTTATITPTFSTSPTITLSSTVTPTLTASLTASSTPSITTTLSSTGSMTVTPSHSSSPTLTATPTQSVTFTDSPTFTASPSFSSTVTQGSPVVTVTPAMTDHTQDSLIQHQAIYPNPASDSVRIFFTLKEKADVRVDIYNVGGEPVAQLALAAATGKNEVLWRGINSNGALCASGIYVIWVHAAGASSTGSYWTQAAILR